MDEPALGGVTVQAAAHRADSSAPRTGSVSARSLAFQPTIRRE
jgi:hypothetical protein